MVGKLNLAEAKDCPCGPQFGGKRRPLDMHDMIELRNVRILEQRFYRPHWQTHGRWESNTPGSFLPGAVGSISKLIRRDDYGTMSR